VSWRHYRKAIKYFNETLENKITIQQPLQIALAYITKIYTVVLALSFDPSQNPRSPFWFGNIKNVKGPFKQASVSRRK
jgi:hypothetical protein